MILNTLDGWLVRHNRQHASQPPEQSVTSDQSEQQQTAAEQPAEEQQQAPQPGTLDSFLVRLDAAAEKADMQGAPAGWELEHSLTRALLHRQIMGRLAPRAAAHAWHCAAAGMRQLASLDSHPWGRGALSSSGLVTVPASGRSGAACIQALQFDSGGELLVAASDEGVLSVHNTQQLLQQLPRGAGGSLLCSPPAASDPLLLLDCGMPRLQSVRWDPKDENVVGLASSATRQLLLFDLEKTQGRPKSVLTVPPQSASLGLAGSVAVGLTDLAFPGPSRGPGYTVLAGGVGGQVFLWDERSRSVPQASLHSSGSGAITCLVLAAGGWAVVAGTQSGEVKVWDLRGGSSSTLQFGGALHHHPLLDSISVRFALTAVPGLADQTVVPASAVQWLQCDTRDERRLGFHLGCGWSGVLDMAQRAVTHLHAPPQQYAAAAGREGGPGTEYAAALHRRACWTPCGTRFVVPSRRSDTLHILDFSPTRYAGCAVPAGRGEDAGAAGSGKWGEGRGGWVLAGAPPPLPAEVQLSQPALCVAAHPGGELLVAGGRGGRLSVVVCQ